MTRPTAVSITGKSTYNHPAMIETFKFFKDLAADGSYHPSTFSIRAPEARALFGAGQAGFIVQGVWCVGSWAQTHPNLKLGVGPAPTPDSGRKGSLGLTPAAAWMGISAKSANAAAAAKYLQAMYSPEYSYQRANVEKGVFFSTVKGINEKHISNPEPE
jgi:ABC-type glycerol-3-phosphate transport system substrate-binding protein